MLLKKIIIINIVETVMRDGSCKFSDLEMGWAMSAQFYGSILNW